MEFPAFTCTPSHPLRQSREFVSIIFPNPSEVLNENSDSMHPLSLRKPVAAVLVTHGISYGIFVRDIDANQKRILYMTKTTGLRTVYRGRRGLFLSKHWTNRSN